MSAFFRKILNASLSTKILAGLILGVLCGLFFGEAMKSIAIIGDVFIKLVQITVLPYIVLSIMHGVGSMTVGNAKLLARRGLPMLLLMWVLALAVFFVLPLAFPQRLTSSFYAPMQEMARAGTNEVEMYVPANPFKSLADGTVPAIVFFSLCIGVALIGMRSKEGLLRQIDLMVAVLGRINNKIVSVSAPIGVFALVANTAGTIAGNQFKNLVVYFAAVLLSVGVLTFLVLPLTVAALTPFSYRQVLSTLKGPLLLSFSTGNVFITLPMIGEGVKTLMSEACAAGVVQGTVEGPEAASEEAESLSVVDTVVPLSYSIPTAGGLVPILFILFAAWFADKALSLAQQAQLAVSGIFTLFGSASVAVPYLLQQAQLPAESYSLYVSSSNIARNIVCLLSVMSMGALTVVVTASVLKLVRFRPAKVMSALLVCALVLGGGILAVRVGTHALAAGSYDGDKVVENMRLESSVPSTIHMPGDSVSPLKDGQTAGKDRYAVIRERGVLRVGYDPIGMPFTYINKRGELVGYDVAKAEVLASRMAVSLEFVPVNRNDFSAALDGQLVDIVMCGVYMTTEKSDQVDFTQPYLIGNPAFVVPDHRKKEYSHINSILAAAQTLRIAVTEPFWVDELKMELPGAEVTLLQDGDDFFDNPNFDALVTCAQEGAFRTLLHPGYDAVIPDGTEESRTFMGYAVAKGQTDFLGEINNFLVMDEKSGIDKFLYDYWILGKNSSGAKARWCIARDVLHWL